MVYMSDSKIYTLGGVAVTPHKPYNPLDLPPYTMRFKFLHDNDDPTTQTWETGVTWTRVSSSPNIWDCTYQNSDWSSLFENKFAYVSWETWNGEAEVLGANIYGVTRLQFLFSNCWLLKAVSLFDTYTVQMFNGMFDRSSVLTVPPFNTENATSLHAMFMSTQITSVPMFNTSNVINMSYMFAGCPMLESVPLFDTSKVWSMEKMLNGCKSLKSIPLFNTSNVTRMDSMCDSCLKVESGALALYNQASSQENPPSEHSRTFRDCGRDTVTGAAELAQIPSDWK